MLAAMRESRQTSTPQQAPVAPVVAIDGPAGSGKSTLAGRMAEALGLPYVNTGLMYRALAKLAVQRGVDPDDAGGLEALLQDLTFDMSGGDPPELLVDGLAEDHALRSPAVEAIVSAVARHPNVRAWMRATQRGLGSRGAVMEGRDIGSVVFPDAAVKLFLSASLDVRAKRRAQELGGRPASADVGRAVDSRDREDARTNPLEPGPDAHVLDSSALDPDQVFDAAMAVVAGSATLPPSRARAARRHVRRLPRVALVGRQNVGKSTLLNRLHGRKVAIAHELPGVTRDRLEVQAEWEGTSFVLVDTGGFAHGARGIEVSVATQAQRAAESADLVLLVVDGATGVQEEDATLARRLLRTGLPTMVVANKVDSERQEAAAGEFAALGLGEAIPVSGLHGRGAGDLLDRVVDLLGRSGGDLPIDGSEPLQPELEDEHRYAIVGKPNVGKSSLFNRLVSEERSVVHDEAGTTRDAVDSIVEVDGLALRFVDTAGLRRRTRTQGVEFYGLLRTERAIEAAQVALLLIDATGGLTAEDKRIASDVWEAGRGLVIVLNKWDLVDADERDHLFKYLRKELRTFPGTPVLRTSATRGTGVLQIVPALEDVRRNWRRRIRTAEVNRAIEALAARHPPPRGAGRIRYATQVSAGPPAFVVFGIGDPGPAYRRYLENALRKEFGFDGVPVRISLRARDRRSAARPRPEGRGARDR
jgi:GTP-binding protein